MNSPLSNYLIVLYFKILNCIFRQSFGDGAAQRTARNYETLPPEVVELVNQAKLRPQQIDQNFDIFVDIVRFATANKYLVPPPSSFSFSFQDKSEYSHLTLGAPLLIDTQDPRQIYKIESSPSGKGYPKIFYNAIYKLRPQANWSIEGLVLFTLLVM